MSGEALSLAPEIKVLRAKARDALSDCVIDDESRYDKTNDDGEKIREIHVRGGGKGKKIEDNVTVPFRPGPSTTGDVDLLVQEAEMRASDEYELGNPHIPRTTEARDAALDRIESAGLSPAWEQ